METIEERLKEALKTKIDGGVYHREGQLLEFKEQFNWAGVAEYYRDFAAFANNKGGMLVFGVTDVPRRLSGLNEKALEAFRKIDPEKISGHLNENFSGHIEWDYALNKHDDKYFACFLIDCASMKPIIAKRDAGKGTIIKNGEIYYRYGGRTQKINYPELEEIINHRIRKNNLDWIEKVKEIGVSGPSNTAILDTKEKSITLGPESRVYVDAKLINDVELIKEGQFREKDAAQALKLSGSVVPVDIVEVENEVVQDRLEKYKLSATELARRIETKCPECKRHIVWKIIATERIKFDSKYSDFNFSKLSDREKYEKTGKVKLNTASIYAPEAVDHIINIFKSDESWSSS